MICPFAKAWHSILTKTGETLTSQSTLTMLSSCKDYPLFDVEAALQFLRGCFVVKAMAKMTDVELMEKYGSGDNARLGVMDVFRILLPPRMLCLPLRASDGIVGDALTQNGDKTEASSDSNR
ncbi:unnamed protein product, partial [Symbiodinium microadriaticum]